MAYMLYVTVTAILLVTSVYGHGTPSASDFIEAMLEPSVYNKKERPLLNEGKPVLVNVDLFVSSISGISEISMDYSINMFLRQRWTDPRLAFKNQSIFNQTITLNYDMISKFWLSDLFITNERLKGSFHDITVPNILLQVAPDGSVLFSQRISSTLACHMTLINYPLDQQECIMEFESYGHTTKDVIFEWTNVSNPVQVNKKMELPEFNLSKISVAGCTAEYATGAFSCIRSTFTLKRLFEYYLIQVYVPSILVVVLSWVSFWIDIHAVPARISVGLLTVLTITTQSSGISSKLPRVSYIKAIDVWMFISMLFVFGALIEYSIVNVLARGHKAKLKALQKKREEMAQLEGDGLPVDLDIKGNDDNSVSFITSNGYSNNNKGSDTSLPRNRTIHPSKDQISITASSNGQTEKNMSWFKRIQFNKALMVDTLSRIAFPAVYIVFNCFYWSYYVN